MSADSPPHWARDERQSWRALNTGHTGRPALNTLSLVPTRSGFRVYLPGSAKMCSADNFFNGPAIHYWIPDCKIISRISYPLFWAFCISFYVLPVTNTSSSLFRKPRIEFLQSLTKCRAIGLNNLFLWILTNISITIKCFTPEDWEEPMLISLCQLQLGPFE